MAIDTTFLMWDNGQVHQWYRAGNGLTLSDRPIAFLGGDTTTSYSSKVRILTNENTRYVFLFDEDNQTITVYDTVGMKTNSAFAQSYDLKYVMRFIFNTPSPLIDVALDNTTANAPVLYLLTSEGIQKVDMVNFIEDIVGEV